MFITLTIFGCFGCFCGFDLWSNNFGFIQCRLYLFLSGGISGRFTNFTTLFRCIFVRLYFRMFLLLILFLFNLDFVFRLATTRALNKDEPGEEEKRKK